MKNKKSVQAAQAVLFIPLDLNLFPYLLQTTLPISRFPSYNGIILPYWQ
jgi:hypothetical protein